MSPQEVIPSLGAALWQTDNKPSFQGVFLAFSLFANLDESCSLSKPLMMMLIMLSYAGHVLKACSSTGMPTECLGDSCDLSMADGAFQSE